MLLPPNAQVLRSLIGIFLLGNATSVHAQNTVDPLLFNNVADGGLVTVVNASSALGGDDPKEAFGQGTGPVEPGTFLFADGNPVGTDNFLEWFTSVPVQISGLRFQGGASGAGVGDPRRIMQLAFAADLDNDGVILGDDPIQFADPDFGDTGDGGSGDITYIFTGGPISASHFGLLVENQEGSGARVGEVDAVIPEPCGAVLGVLGLGVFGVRRRR